MSLRTGPVADEPRPDRPSLDELFDICGNQRRRLALEYLAANEGADLAAVARHVAAREAGTPAERLPRRQRKSVYNSLYQTHVPRMARAGIVECDEDRTHLVPGPNFDRVEPYVDRTDGGAEPRSSHYFGLSLAGGLLLTVDSAGVLSSLGVPDLAATPLIVALFALLTLAYVSDSDPVDSLRRLRSGSRGQS